MTDYREWLVPVLARMLDDIEENVPESLIERCERIHTLATRGRVGGGLYSTQVIAKIVCEWEERQEIPDRVVGGPAPNPYYPPPYGWWGTIPPYDPEPYRITCTPPEDLKVTWSTETGPVCGEANTDYTRDREFFPVADPGSAP